MKLRSIAGPLILIALGVLLLFHNLRPEIPLFELFARYWPFLLIVWGVVRLSEVLFWYFAGKPLPARGVSGGEWLLVVFLCLFGATSFWGMNIASRWPAGRITARGLEMFGQPYEFPVSGERKVEKNPKVVLELGRGNAKIVGKDTDTLTVSGRKTIRAFEQSDAERHDKETPLEVVSAAGQWVIRTNQERLGPSSRISSDLEISLPKDASFVGRGRYGDFDVSNLTGDVEIQSDNAGVRVQNIGGGLKADLRRSDLVRAVNIGGPIAIKGRGQDLELENIAGQVYVNGSYSGELSFRELKQPLRFESSQTELRVEKTQGSVRVDLSRIVAEQVEGPIRVSTTSRDVQLRDFVGPLDISLERGDVELRPLRPPSGKIDVRTRSGNVDLLLPPGSRFELSAITDRGEISNFYGEPLRLHTEGRGARLEGSTGAGPSILLHTDRGSITVRRLNGSGSDKELLPKALPEQAQPRPGHPIRQ